MKKGASFLFFTILIVVFLVSCCGKQPLKSNINIGSHPVHPETAYFIYQELYVPSPVPGAGDINLGTMSGSGSGIRNTRKYTDVLTAAHVCQLPIEVQLMGGRQTITLFNIHGQEYFGEIYALDFENDLCLIRIDGKKPVLRIAREDPGIGDSVFYAGYPNGLYKPGLLHFFHGYFNGIDSERSGYYSIPAAPGSSGSAIVNSRGLVVGLVSAVMANFHNSTIGPSVEPINMFLLLSENCDKFCVK